MTVIESVFTDFDRETPIVSPEILNWELKIGCRSIHANQYQQEGVCILTQDRAWEYGNFIALSALTNL
jgi:hypothetical protein